MEEKIVIAVVSASIGTIVSGGFLLFNSWRQRLHERHKTLVETAVKLAEQRNKQVELSLKMNPNQTVTMYPTPVTTFQSYKYLEALFAGKSAEDIENIMKQQQKFLKSIENNQQS